MLAYLPMILVLFVYGLPFYLLGKKKGYDNSPWLIACFFPGVNVVAAFYIVGLPDLVARQMLEELLARSKNQHPV